MDAQRWRRVREMFERVVDLPAAQREATLADWCADDPALHAEVLALLRADAATDGDTAMFARAPNVAAGIADVLDAVAGGPRAGLVLGPFRLLHEIGRGGMGSVWLAERADGQFTQRVAIKLIRGGWDVAETQTRFLAERQILATLQHPHIAHLVDGGVSADGRPWLALEYVAGVDLRQWCDSRQLDLRERLALFLTVCEAVEHAHQRLVVHRDLKPSNILVSDDGVVKLLDFGIAKLLDARNVAASVTRLFTPEYAAPEQVRGDAVTTAVDIHALGLLLYELLAGQRPYQVEHSTPAAYERAILDQEPTRPSLSLTRDASQAVAIAAKRHLTPERLRRELRGDLDAIVLKALRKQPAQRYASVGEFVADLRRYLGRQPVLARRGHWRYHATRFVQRHAVAMALATVAVLALAVGFGTALWQARLARAERDAAREALAFTTSLFDNADPARRKGDAVSLRDVLDTGVQNIRGALSNQETARARLLLTMASAYLGLGQREPAAPLIDEALAVAQARGDRVLQAAALIQRCRLLDLGNESDACPALLDQAESALDVSDPEQARLVAYSLALRVYGWQLDNRYDLIEAAMRRGIALLGDAPAQRFLRVELAGHLAFALDKQNRPAEAEAVLRPTLAQLRGDAAAERVLLADTLGTLATAVAHQQRTDEAIVLQREALAVMEALYGADDPAVSPQLNSLAVLLNGADRIDEALPLLARTVDLDRRRGPEATHELASSLCNYGALLLLAGRADAARAAFDESVDVAARSGIAMELGRCLLWRATLALTAGDAAAARRDAGRARDVLAPSYPAESDLMLRVRSADLAAQWLAAAPAAATCDEAQAITASYARSARSGGPDAHFAAFLGTLCSDGHAVAPAQAQAALRSLQAALSRGEHDPRARVAAALLARWPATPRT